MLFIDSVTVRDTYLIHHKGILGELECRLWNSQLLLWGFFVSSTWNLVTLTFERFVTARVCGKVMFSHCLSVRAINFECLEIDHFEVKAILESNG